MRKPLCRDVPPRVFPGAQGFDRSIHPNRRILRREAYGKELHRRSEAGRSGACAGRHPGAPRRQARCEPGTEEGAYGRGLQGEDRDVRDADRTGELRGCIGSLEGRSPSSRGWSTMPSMRRSATPASGPLSKELDKIRIEVSILTEPETLAYSDADLLNKLRPGIDGVIIRQGYAGATFLPQVWEQLPDKEKGFLAHHA
ncbi:MAG: AMMECR1 domain-containing protein [Desulfobacterales bacterium]|nr:AMMECR1 domain-containing protein [Desulfobacterales bacterium]